MSVPIVYVDASGVEHEESVTKWSETLKVFSFVLTWANLSANETRTERVDVTSELVSGIPTDISVVKGVVVEYTGTANKLNRTVPGFGTVNGTPYFTLSACNLTSGTISAVFNVTVFYI